MLRSRRLTQRAPLYAAFVTTLDLIVTLGDDAAQVAEAGAAARGEASGTLKPSADMASSTFEFDLFVKNDHLEGPSSDEPILDRAATSP